MMNRTQLSLRVLGLCLLSLLGQNAQCQAPLANTSQQLVFAGLRSLAAHGQINSVKTNAAGDIYLLLDENDGVRLLEIDPSGTNVLAEARLGAAGDVGLAMTLDPAGNLLVTGTSTSSTFAASAGAAFPARTDATIASFVAKFDPALHTSFVTFTGGSRIAASAIAATSTAVFITGSTFSVGLPVTGNAVQKTAAPGSTQNGFIEKFSIDGRTLLYASYLSGAQGDTNPTAITADSEGNAYVVGSTTAPGLPTLQALVPTMLSNPSGFALKLAPAGDTFLFSTFIPGPGLSSIVLSSTGGSLLITGAIALGQFPVDTVTNPLVPAIYQVLLRMPLDGSTVESSTLIAPGLQSSVAAASADTAWVSGVLSSPLLPIPALATIGAGFTAHVIPGRGVDQTARYGGLPNTNATFANLPALITSVAVDPAGNALVAGAIEPTASASLLATETYDLPLHTSPTQALPSTLRDAELSAASCSGSLCAGSAAYLAKLNPNLSAPALAFSTDDAPRITLRNLGSAAATNLQLSASTGTFATTCNPALPAGGECSLLLSGGAAGTVTALAGNSTAETAAFSSFTSANANTIVFTPKELDFGIQTSSSDPAAQTLTLSNLGPAAQTFTSALDSSAAAASPFREISSDCATSSTQTKTLSPGATCHITLGLAASSSSSNDGFALASWLIGDHDVLLTGYSQAASLSLSTSEIDFGTQFTGGLQLPRYLYLSNSSAAALAHAPLIAPSGSSFTLVDECPTTLPAASVCRIRIDYLAPATPSNDALSLQLDAGLSVLITGQTLPPPAVSGGNANVDLSVAPASIVFPDATFVTEVSATTRTVTLSNTGASTLPLSFTLLGDFSSTTTCGASLASTQSCTISFTFSPTLPGPRQGFLTIATTAGSTPIYLPLSGTASAILATSSSSLDLGTVPVGQPTTVFLKVLRSFSTLTASASASYSVVLVEDVGFGHGQPSSLSYAPTASGSCHNCYIGLQFKPITPGDQPGTLTLTSGARGSPFAISLAGVGTPINGLVLSPATEDFSSVPVHSNGPTTWFTFTNLLPNRASITLTPSQLSGDFVIDPTPTGGPLCVGTLAYTASCFIGVAFAPTATGVRTGVLTIASESATISASLTGLGTADPGLSISPLALVFSDVPSPSSSQQIILLRNTGTIPLQVAPATNSSPRFTSISTCGTLAPAATCSVTVHFEPTDTVILDTLRLGVSRTIGSSSPQTTSFEIPLSGAYTAASAALEIIPNQASFGPTIVGTLGSTRQFTINNLTAKTLALNLNLPRDFILAAPPCAQLIANASCTFALTFLPLTSGDHAASLAAQAVPADGSPVLTGIAYAEGFGTAAGALTLSGGLIVDHVFSFGQVNSGQPASSQAASQTFTYTNNNPPGTSPITIRRVLSPPPFLSATTCSTPLAPTQSCTVSVTYQPANFVALGTLSPPSTSDFGTLTVESDAASSPDILNLSGQAGPFATANPPNASTLATFQLSQQSLTFPFNAVGSTSPSQTITLTNTGNVALHLSPLTTSPDFSVRTACTTLAAGASCAILVASTPQSPGAHIAALAITSDSTISLDYVSLFSNAEPSPLTFSPATYDFGSVALGTSAQLPLTFTNAGSTPITALTFNASADYALTPPCPTTIAPASTCATAITFTPSTVGARPGTLTLTSPDLPAPIYVPLTGTGTASPTFSLSVGGTSSATASVRSGDPATFQLTLTPLNGFKGPVSLTCVAQDAAPSATCSLLPASVTLGGGPLTSVASISTRSGLATANRAPPFGAARSINIALACLLLPGMLAFWGRRLRLSRPRPTLFITLCAALALVIGGCGSKNNFFSSRDTPAGTYRFQVTASSTSGLPTTQTVTLNLVVTAR